MENSASNAKHLVVLGLAGRGKSTFLNYVAEGVDTEEKLFATSSGSSSVTLEVKEYKCKIHGTQKDVVIYDTPGCFAADLQLTSWIDILKKGLPSSFDAVLLILNIKERMLDCDAILFKSLEQLFINFRFENIILVFTHCDSLLLKDVKAGRTLQTSAQAWLEDLKRMFKEKEALRKILDSSNKHVYFGREEKEGVYKHEYQEQLITAINTLPPNKISVNQNVDLAKLKDTVLDSISPEFKSSVDKTIAELGERIKELQTALQNRPADSPTIHIHNPAPAGPTLCNMM